MSTKFRPITHIITGTSPVNPWPPTGNYALCARLYTNTFLDHITVNTVSWNYDGGSSPTYSDTNCTQELSDLSSWNDSTANTVLQTTGQNEYGTYVDIFTNGQDERAVDFCVILGNDRRQTITDDSWKITRVEVFKVGMTNGIYRVNYTPSKGQWFRSTNDWAEFPLTPSSITIFRPITIFENIQDPPAPTIPTVLMPDGKYWTDTNLSIDDGGEGISIVNDVTANGVNFGTQYYYTWDAAVRVASNISGYHLPTLTELSTLSNIELTNASNNLKTTTGWPSGYNGINKYSFNAYPTGPTEYWFTVGNYCTMWTSDEENNDWAYGGYLEYNGEYLYNANIPKSNHCSVRLIKY